METHPDSLMGMAMADLSNKRLGEENPLLPRARKVQELADSLDADITALTAREIAIKSEIEALEVQLAELAARKQALEDVRLRMRAGPPEARSTLHLNYPPKKAAE